MTTKSNNTLKFIKRNIQTNIQKNKETAYKTYVRPLLEYSATVWDPWQKKYINQIEMVQHRAVRYIFNDYNFTSSVSSMLNQLALSDFIWDFGKLPFPTHLGKYFIRIGKVRAKAKKKNMCVSGFFLKFTLGR